MVEGGSVHAPAGSVHRRAEEIPPLPVSTHQEMAVVLQPWALAHKPCFDPSGEDEPSLGDDMGQSTRQAEANRDRHRVVAGSEMDVEARPARVFVADRRALVREGLSALLGARHDIEMVGGCGNLAEVETEVAASRPDVILVEMEMILAARPGAIRRILSAHLDARMLLLGEHADRRRVLSGLRGGASGYIPTRAAASELIAAIRAVRRGEGFLHHSVARMLVTEYLRAGEKMNSDPYDRLSNREKEILRLLVQGDTSREIAESLKIAPRAVTAHRARIMVKLDARNQAELVRFAIRRKLTTIESPAT